jgi:hypothetical protein
MQRGLKVRTLQGPIKKTPILLSQYWKSDNFRREALCFIKEMIPKWMQRGLRVITLQGAIEKTLILLPI